MTRLLHLSDPHFGAADERIAQSFLRQAAEFAPDLTLLSGDLTMRARRAELRGAKDFVEQLPQPRLVIPGNHDIPAFNQLFDRFFRPFRRYCDTFGNALEPSLQVGEVEVVSLNSSRAYGLHDWSEGRLSHQQLGLARRRFRDTPGGLRVLVLHHPLVAPPDDRRAVVKPLRALLSLVAAARVDLVLCGHFHQSHLAVVAADPSWQCVVSQAPTVCSTRLQGEPQGFHEIRHEGERLQIVLHRHQNGRFVESATWELARGPQGWSTAG